MSSSSLNLTFFGAEPKLIFSFVLQNGEMSEAMKLAFEAARKYFTIEFIKTLTESECLKIPKSELKEKKKIFIFDKFSGPAFEYIEAVPGCWILGNRCLLTMLSGNVPLPADIPHVHNLSMRGLIICLSQMDLEEKKKIKKLVGYMGGIHLDNLRDSVTHLVTKSVISLKYEEAGRNGLNIMHPDWVHRVWSKTQDISFSKRADDEQFESFRLPIFFDLNVSSTGLKLAIRNKVKMMIEENGGKFHPSFRPNHIQILLLESDSIGNEKYKSAIRNKKPCVKPQWVLDSIKEGYALSVNAYLVKAIRASTPTKESNVTVSKFNPDQTRLSEIFSGSSVRNLTINETILSRASDLSVAGIQSMNNIFKKPNIPHFSLDPKPTLEQNGEKKDDIELSSQYLKPNAQSTLVHELIKAPEQIVTADDTEDVTVLEPIFAGKYINFYGFKDAADTLQIIKDCENMRGTMVDDSYSKEVDYVITQTILSEFKPRVKYRNLVNELWILQCMSEQKLLDVEYYHKPLVELQPEEKRPLDGETIVVTNYKQQEREFISMMVTVLGGNYIEILNMEHKPILISPNTVGRKAESALKWGLTVLSVDWLRECLKFRDRADETAYLIGGSKVSLKNIKARYSFVPSSQEPNFDARRETSTTSVTPPIDNKENKNSDDEFTSNRIAGTPVLIKKRFGGMRVAEVSASPKTPQSRGRMSDYKYHDVDDLVAAMPTPQRQHTMAVLDEIKDKNTITPRSRRLQALVDSPDMESLMEPMSPMPDLPECMKPPPVNYALRPGASPETQWFHKRKIDVLDQFYNPIPREKPAEKKPVTPPSYRRYDFLKARLPGYNSPDPRLSTEAHAPQLGTKHHPDSELSTGLASKWLNFGDEEFSQ